MRSAGGPAGTARCSGRKTYLFNPLRRHFRADAPRGETALSSASPPSPRSVGLAEGNPNFPEGNPNFSEGFPNIVCLCNNNVFNWLRRTERNSMRRIPAQRPVDREPHAGLGDGGEDSIGVGERGRKGLFQEVDAERSDRLDAIGMARPWPGREWRGPARSPARNVRYRETRALPGWRGSGSGRPSARAPDRKCRRFPHSDVRAPRAGGRPCAYVRN